MRIKNSIRNILTSMAGQVFGIVITFVSRIYFVKTLGGEYLGINGLFTNILSILSLAEMGFSTAIIYSLYKPLASSDSDSISELMNFYAKVYRIIGTIIFVIGILIFPFLDYLIKDKPQVPYLNQIYLMYLANSVISYFFAYKRSLIIADQKNHIVTFYRYSFFFLLNIVQILILLLTKNFIIYLLMQIIFTLFENLMISRKADKLYPFLNESSELKIDSINKKVIFKNVRAMMYHRIGGVIVTGTDNILISKFEGILLVGIYSNYYLIISALNSIINQLFVSITSSVGNLNAVESKQKSYYIYKVIFFANFWIVGFSTISLFILLNPFIALWLGKEYLMNETIVILIVMNFYITGMRKTTLVFRDSLGLFWNDRYKPIFEALINLVASIILGKYFGIIGILLGTFISTITTCFWIEPFILYKYGFKRNLRDYFAKYLLYTFVMVVAGIIIRIYSKIFISVTLFNLIGMFLACTLIINTIFIICFYKTEEFKYIYDILNSLIGKRLKNKKDVE